MIYIRSDVRDDTFHALLSTLTSPGPAVVGMRVERTPGGDLGRAIADCGELTWRRSYPGGESLDPLLLAELPLAGPVIDVVVDAFGASLVGPVGRNDVHDLYVVDGGNARRTLLTTISSEAFAALDVDDLTWQRLCGVDPLLAAVVTASEDFRFVDDHRVADLWSALEDAADEESVDGVLRGALHAAGVRPHDALAAAALVAEAVAPGVVGNLGWRWADRVLMGPRVMPVEVVTSATRVLSRVLGDRVWQSACDAGGRRGASATEARRLLAVL